MERPSMRNVVLAPYAPVKKAEETEESAPKNFLLEDPEGFAPPLVVPVPLAVLISLMDGERTREEICREFGEAMGQTLELDELNQIVDHFNSLWYLDSPEFAAFLREEMATFQAAENRPARMAGGGYPETAEKLKTCLDKLLTLPPKILAADGEEETLENQFPPNVEGMILPHIDYDRGGVAYGWGGLALRDHCDADTFLILGTCHNPMREKFALTTKSFETPLGLLETDKSFVEELDRRFQKKYAKRDEKKESVDLFADEFVHRDEHSIEFAAVLLKYLENQTGRKLRIVPVLMNSFVPFLADQEVEEPCENEVVGTFLKTLAEMLAQEQKRDGGRKIAILASADLSHVGPMFGSPEPVDVAGQDQIGKDDMFMMFAMMYGSAKDFWKEIVRTDDANQLCGIAPIYTLLKLLNRKAQGNLLSYEQSIDEETGSCVSFATIVYGRDFP
ncbi:MAG: AmmeMemoRadiSam system protein B [Planctomycetia bacterium]|nr:AmmeMemoRadiSam system protein B [Planctomycetia bacterium]